MKRDVLLMIGLGIKPWVRIHKGTHLSQYGLQHKELGAEIKDWYEENFKSENMKKDFASRCSGSSQTFFHQSQTINWIDIFVKTVISKRYSPKLNLRQKCEVWKFQPLWTIFRSKIDW